MKLEQSFEVDAPLQRVWEALVDVEQVAPCLPGAAVTGRNDDGTYNGTFTIKIGPTTASYAGKLEMQDVDESSHTATLHAQGSDKRGQGGATATIVSTLVGLNGGTRVQVVTDYHITGRLARFGRGGMIEDISERLLREFAGRLQSSLAGGDTSEAATAVHQAVGAQKEETSPPPTEAAAAMAETSPPPTEAAAAATEPEPPPPPAPEASQQPAPPPPPPAPAAPPPPASAAHEAPPPPPKSPPPPVGPPPPQGESAPLDAGSLVGSVIVEKVKRNPAPYVAAAAGGLILLRLLTRRR